MGFTTGSSIFLFSNLAFLDLCWDYCVLIWCFRDLPTVTPTSCYAQMTSSFFLRMSDSLQLWLMAHLQSPYSTLIVNNQIFMYIGLGNLDQCLLSSNHRIPAHLCGTDVIVILPMNYRPCLSAWFLGLLLSMFTLPLPFPLISCFHIVVFICSASVVWRPGSKFSLPVKNMSPSHVY